jgi:hypothetical protein
MKRNPALLLAYVLAVAPGTLLFPVVAGAIPDNQKHLIVTTELTPAYRTNYPKVIIEENKRTDENPVQQDGLSFASHICGQNPGSLAPVKYSTKGKSCVDPSDPQQRFSVQFGRRIGTGGDILGEFDGLRVNYRLSEVLKLNGIAGYPVLAAQDKFNSERQVFGVSVATEQLGRTWDLNGYLIEQQENGQTNGKSMGGIIRRLQSVRSFLAYLNYDLSDNSLGVLMASGAWRLPFKTTISATFDRRNHPIPAYQQKFLRQSMTVTEGWNWILPTDRLAHYTGDGYGEVSTLSFGLSHALSQRIKLSGDVAVLDTTDDADTAPETTAYLSEYSYHLQLSGKDLLMPGDRNKLDLRYNVTETDQISTAAFDTKLAISRFWNIMPKLRADYHNTVLESSPRWVASPTVRMEYQQTKQTSFNIEAGGEWSSRMEAITDDTRSCYFVSLGYQAKF